MEEQGGGWFHRYSDEDEITPYLLIPAVIFPAGIVLAKMSLALVPGAGLMMLRAVMKKTINPATLQFCEPLPEATLIIILLKRFAYKEIVPLIKKKNNTRTSIAYHPVDVERGGSLSLCRRFQSQGWSWDG